jgi:PKHD-type hydroxylase
MAFFLLGSPLTGQVSVNGFLTSEECRRVIECGERNLNLSAGTTEDRRSSMRKSDVGWLGSEAEHQWLFQRIKDCINEINRNWFGYNLTGFEGIQFTKYSQDEGGGDFYSAHKDTKLLPGGTIRKLSFTIQLCDADVYDGGDVLLYDSFTDSVALNRSVGSITFFPSYTIHEVTPVTIGTRYSLVGGLADRRLCSLGGATARTLSAQVRQPSHSRGQLKILID